jgi:type IVB pilus formation R64 PilN family outer membrane protein
MKSNLNVVFALLTVSALAGCATQLDRDVVQAVSRNPDHLQAKGLVKPGTDPAGSPAAVQTRAEQFKGPLVRKSGSPWLGGAVVTKRDARLPAVFDQKHVLDFGSERVSLSTVAARLTKLTSIPVRIRSDVYEVSADATAPSTRPDQGLPALFVARPDSAVDTNPPRPATPTSAASPLIQTSPISIDAVEMRWNGRLRDFLDHLTNSLSLAWEYQDGAVVIMRLVTETYQIATTPGKQTFAISAGGSGSGGGSEGGVSMTSQSTTNISTSGVIEVRESILKTINNIISSVPNSFASWSDGTGRIVVATSKENQARVREYLSKENKYLSQRVNVTFDIYSVRQKDADEQGVDWSTFFNSLNTRYGVKFMSPAQLTGSSAASLTLNATSADLSTNHKAILSLLSQYGESAQHRPVSLTASQGVWETTGKLSTTGYLKETTPGNAGISGAAGAPGLKTDLITTGDQYSVLPIVQSDNSTLVRFSITLSDLLGLFDVTTGEGETLQKVQTPQIEAITKGSMINLKPGETVVITGLSRRVAKRDENRLTKDTPILAGGSRKAEIVNEQLLILLRATPL